MRVSKDAWQRDEDDEFERLLVSDRGERHDDIDDFFAQLQDTGLATSAPRQPANLITLAYKRRGSGLAVGAGSWAPSLTGLAGER